MKKPIRFTILANLALLESLVKLFDGSSFAGLANPCRQLLPTQR